MVSQTNVLLTEGQRYAWSTWTDCLEAKSPKNDKMRLWTDNRWEYQSRAELILGIRPKNSICPSSRFCCLNFVSLAPFSPPRLDLWRWHHPSSFISSTYIQIHPSFSQSTSRASPWSNTLANKGHKDGTQPPCLLWFRSRRPASGTCRCECSTSKLTMKQFRSWRLFWCSLSFTPMCKPSVSSSHFLHVRTWY